MEKRLRVLGIESSCDETAVAILEIRGDEGVGKVRVTKNLVTSQIPIHQKYGGVVPEVAARSHVPEAVSLLTQALGKRGIEAFDAIAVTRGPGLATALRVGIESARVLAMVSGKPLIGVNHLEGHLASAWLDATNRRHWKFPLLALIVSGGHTELVLIKDDCRYRLIGQTRDDAAGEAFDKSAKLMGLPYPGGPEIAKLALDGNPKAFAFPRPMSNDPSFDFSFSGLKTAVRQEWESIPLLFEEALAVSLCRTGLGEERAFGLAAGCGAPPLTPPPLGGGYENRKNDFAASLQQAIVDVLVAKTLRAAKEYRVNGVLLVGGVSANRLLRDTLAERLPSELPGVAFLPSDRRYITDNAAMIAAAGYWRLRKGEKHDWKKMDADPEWELS